MAVESTMLPLGTEAPGFSLPDTDGRTVSLDDFRGAPALLVVFLCNHCPYVKHLRAAIADVARRYADKGVATVGISSNDPEQYPEDSPEAMAREKEEAGYPFPTCTTSRRRWPRRTGPPAPRTSSSSTGSAGWCTEGSSTPPARATTSPSPGRTCALRWTPCWRAAPFPPSRSPASAAGSSGGWGTRRIRDMPREVFRKHGSRHHARADRLASASGADASRSGSSSASPNLLYQREETGGVLRGGGAQDGLRLADLDDPSIDQYGRAIGVPLRKPQVVSHVDESAVVFPE